MTKEQREKFEKQIAQEKRIAELEETCNKWFEHLKNREEELLNELNNQNAKYNKQIEELEEEVTRLRNENLDIINKYTGFAETDRRTIAELEAQIEKMKSCVNCRYCINEKCPWQPKGCKMEHWELRR